MKKFSIPPKGLLLASVLFFSLCVMGSLRDPVATDQVDLIYMARSCIHRGKPFSMVGILKLWSPPLYIVSLSFWLRLFGESDVAAKFFGVTCVLLTACVTYLLAREIWKEKKDPRLPVVAAALFLTSPAVIQGALWVDIDPTLLSLVVNFFLFCLLRSKATSWGRAFRMGALLAMSLWTKLSSPFLAIGSFWICSFFARDRGRRVLFAASVFAAGLSLFAATWLLVCRLYGFPVWDPFRYGLYKSAATRLQGLPAVIVKELGLRSLRILLWFSPYWLVLCMTSIGRVVTQWKERKAAGRDRETLALFVFSVFTIFLWSGGTIFGYPKYHMPLFPAACTLIAGLLPAGRPDKRSAAALLTMWVFVSLLFFVRLGDPILDLNFRLRWAMVQGESAVWDIFQEGAKKGILLLAVPFFVFMILRRALRFKSREAWILSFFLLTFSYHAAVGSRQMLAPYLTGAAHGDRGTKEMIAFLKERARSPGILLADMDIIYHLDGKFPHVHYTAWKSVGHLSRELQRREVQGLVYSVGHNEVKELSEVFSAPEVQTILNRYFAKTEIGTFTIWLRNHGG